jgi:hypothetical protein
MFALLALAAATAAPLDPAALAQVSLDRVEWKTGPNNSSALIAGDPTKAGLYVQLVKWHAGHMSRPHFHDHVRVITVLEGVWWVGTGRKYDPDHMTPIPAGTVVTHFAGGVHYDGARAEDTIIEIVGEGPVATISAEDK